MTENPYKPSLFDRAICAVAPISGLKRLAAKQVIHEYGYDGARMNWKRETAPQNIAPNSFDVQRDRLQLMREAEDLERNFSPAKTLNQKVALYVSPISYHAATGDPELDKAVEEYLNEEVFPNCDITGRYDFFKMLEFGVMGRNRSGDYGWAFQRPGLALDASVEDAIALPLKLQAVEPDRIGGLYQNVVSDNYVAGLILGEYGEVVSYRVFKRSQVTSQYTDPVDVPADQFVHYTDPLRIDQYRGVSELATAVTNMRDFYESIDFAKGKMKLASALTVFTNSNGARTGSGGMDAYQSNLPPQQGSPVLQQDIMFGQINHLTSGQDIKFPSSTSPSSEEQYLLEMLLKLVAMSYNLPYSFALDASALGGVSSRLESQLAKAEFTRRQKALEPHANRMKNAFLFDAVAKGVFPVEKLKIITRGRWGYRPHPQPDIGREATAAMNLYQTGLLNPISYWVDNGEDPEEVAKAMRRWWEIKKAESDIAGVEMEVIFGAGPSKPINKTESTSEQTGPDGQPIQTQP